MTRQAIDDLKRHIPLMAYLEAQDWRPQRPLSGGRWMGVCPLHEDHKPSFLVDPQHGLFYCYGCGRGGDIFRFIELYHQLNFAQALVSLLRWQGHLSLLCAAANSGASRIASRNEAAAASAWPDRDSVTPRFRCGSGNSGASAIACRSAPALPSRSPFC